MPIGRITYEDKIDSSVNEQDPKHKITAQDMNEIKQVFNESAEDIEFATENLGDYKVENGIIYFKKADGSYNEQGITLAGQSSVLDGNGNVILSGNITPNDNLLTNSDFKSGIINQQGKVSYSKGSEDWEKMYSIDMWALQRGIQLDVNEDNISVKCTNSNEPGYLLQKIDYVGKATAVINIKSITGSVSLNTTYGKYELLKKGLNIITYDFGFEQSQGWFSMRISEGATVVIDYMKLEKGEYFTGMPVWNRERESEKCYWRLSLINGLRVPCVEKSNINNQKFFAFSVPRVHAMVGTPSVSVIGNGTINSISGICMRQVHETSGLINMKSYEFEVRPWEVLVRCYVDNSVDVPNIDVQLYINDNFIILLDSNSY